MTDLMALAADMADLSGNDHLPPVEKWEPERCGDIDITIRRDGVWVHEGSPIARPRLVRLFSTVLRRDQDGYYLVTPVEKLKLTVEDVPFVAVAMTIEGEGADRTVTFRTNVGDTVTAGPDHPITFNRDAAEPQAVVMPYVEVRRGLKARLSRPVYYDFVALLEGDPPSLKSAGAVFAMDDDSTGS